MPAADQTPAQRTTCETCQTSNTICFECYRSHRERQRTRLREDERLQPPVSPFIGASLSAAGILHRQRMLEHLRGQRVGA